MSEEMCITERGVALSGRRLLGNVGWQGACGIQERIESYGIYKNNTFYLYRKAIYSSPIVSEQRDLGSFASGSTS